HSQCTFESGGFMKPKSQTLFHFTKNLDFVKNILTDGFWPRYCLEDFSWYIHNIDYIAFPMVCFCDIPLSRIKEHVGFYGEYGVGVTKEWAIANRLNPVSYLSRTSNYGSAVNNLFKNIDITGQKAYYENAGFDLNMLLSHF
ncbi:TPA: abortive infection system antitoxin AbiGi family protein, partial [Vibrio parahaemolyticus]